jgi:hypothetical protein
MKNRKRKHTDMVKSVLFEGDRVYSNFLVFSDDINDIEEKFLSFCEMRKKDPKSVVKKSWIQ